MLALRSSGRAALTLAMAALLVVAACAGSSPATQAPPVGAPTTAPAVSAPPQADVSQAPTESSQPAGDTDDLSGAAANLSNIESFKFKIVMAGGSFGKLAGAEPITGTVTKDPKAAQMSVMGMEVVEIDGKSWIKIGTKWIESKDDSTTSIARPFAPEKMFGSTLGGSAAEGYRVVGEEQKNA